MDTNQSKAGAVVVPWFLLAGILTCATCGGPFRAAATGDVDALDKEMRKGSPVDVRNEKGETPLMVAAESGQIEAVKFLLDCGANVNGEDKDGDTPLMHAAVAGHGDVVRLLLKRGAKVNAQNKRGWTAAVGAVALSGYEDVIRTLLEAGGSVAGYKALLGCAVSQGWKAPVIDLLINAGSDLNQWSPLACDHNDFTFTPPTGFHPKNQGEGAGRGVLAPLYTPFMIACSSYYGYVDGLGVADHLVRRGAKLDDVTDYGYPVWYFSTRLIRDSKSLQAVQGWLVGIVPRESVILPGYRVVLTTIDGTPSARTALLSRLDEQVKNGQEPVLRTKDEYLAFDNLRFAITTRPGRRIVGVSDPYDNHATAGQGIAVDVAPGSAYVIWRSDGGNGAISVDRLVTAR